MLDSFALLAFLEREPAADRVRSLLRAARATGEPVVMNEVNVGEVYYVIARRRTLEEAEQFLARLESLPIRLVSNDLSSVIDAARLKAERPISYADAFAAATAIREKAALVTGAPEIRTLQDRIEIDWLGSS